MVKDGWVAVRWLDGAGSCLVFLFFLLVSILGYERTPDSQAWFFRQLVRSFRSFFFLDLRFGVCICFLHLLYVVVGGVV